jgi:hypothetical protein
MSSGGGGSGSSGGGSSGSSGGGGSGSSGGGGSGSSGGAGGEFGTYSAFVGRRATKGAPTAYDMQQTCNEAGVGLLKNTWAGIGVVHEEHFDDDPQAPRSRDVVVEFEEEYIREHSTSRSVGAVASFSRSGGAGSAFAEPPQQQEQRQRQGASGDSRKVKRVRSEGYAGRVRSASDHSPAVSAALQGRAQSGTQGGAQGAEQNTASGSSFFKRLTNNFGLR